MARNKETVVVLLDVSPSMHPKLPAATKAIELLGERKLLFKPVDEVALVLFGTDDTDNDLHRDYGAYDHVMVASQIQPTTIQFLELLQFVTGGSKAGDFLDAVVVACDLIIKHLGQGRKGNKRLWLITDASSPLRPPEEGTTIEQQLDLIAGTLEREGIELEVLLFPPPTPGNNLSRSPESLKSEAVLRQLAINVRADLVPVSNPLKLLGSVRSNLVAPVTTYRGDFELTPNMKIKVWVYKKTQKQAGPKVTSYSDRAPEFEPSATRQVMMEREYKSTEDMDVSVPPEERTTAYRYGPHLIPIAQAEKDTLKFKTEKGVRLIGFAAAAKIPRHFYMKEASLFVPEPGNECAARAVSALARSLHASKRVAIARCVFTARAKVVIGVLCPHLASEDHIPDALSFNLLPFAEDLREFTFASFTERPISQQPTAVQLQAASDLVRKLELVRNGEELLQPEYTLDPALQRVCSLIRKRAIDPDADVATLEDDPVTKMLLSVPPSASAEPVDEFRRRFVLVPSQTEKTHRKFWQDMPPPPEPPLEDGGSVPESGVTTSGPISLEGLTARGVEEVGSVDPVQDFKALLARRDGDYVPKAVGGMKKIISDLLDSAYNGNTYNKALECLVALRLGCVMQDEPLDFNAYLRKLGEQCRGKRLNDFWQLVVSKGLTLISRDDNPDSDISREEAADFLKGPAAAPQAAPPPKEEEMDDMDALLDEAL